MHYFKLYFEMKYSIVMTGFLIFYLYNQFYWLWLELLDLYRLSELKSLHTQTEFGTAECTSKQTSKQNICRSSSRMFLVNFQ